MATSKNLSDYKNYEMLEVYDQLANTYDEPSARTRYYTLHSNLPSLEGKIILDIPCGIGNKGREAILKNKAEKVIAVDIVEEQIQYSISKDNLSGIKEGQIEYVVHDCKIPRKLSYETADIGLCVHLFCFAKTYQEFLDFAKCIYLNLKAGSECFILICSLTKDPETYRKLEQFDLEIIKIDPYQDGSSEPRKFHTKYQGFNFDCWLWDYQTICEALLETGFTEVEKIRYVEDQDYNGNHDLKLYNKITDGYILRAVKDL